MQPETLHDVAQGEGSPHRLAPPTSQEATVQKVRGVVARQKGAPVTVETVLAPDPGPGEAVVRVQTCGVCHTDLHYREGASTTSSPSCSATRPRGRGGRRAGVDDVAPGDSVILNWRAVCGDCGACRRGGPWYCFATLNTHREMTLEDGGPLDRRWASVPSPEALVPSGQCTKVDPRTSPPPWGCSAAASWRAGRGDDDRQLGRARRGGPPVRGSWGARRSPVVLAGAGTVIAVDLHPRKLDRAPGFGRPRPCSPPGTTSSRRSRCLPWLRRRRVIEAVGDPAWKQALYARDLAGTVVLVGVPTPDMRIPVIPLIDFFGRGGCAEALVVRRPPAGPGLPER